MTTALQTKDRLALDGGDPVRTGPLAPWPYFDEELVNAAAAVLRSGQVNYWTGEETRNFEQEFAESEGTAYAVAVSNGSVALELALHALNVGPGDEVIVPCRTFLATAGSVVIRGARPVFADVDPVSQNITVDTIAPLVTPRTKAIIVVHLAGWPCQMDAIMEFARARKLFVIEDCAQAHGAKYKDRPVGSFGDAAAFSFCQDKIITTGGEGGMVTTNRRDVWERAWSYKDHGKSWNAVYHSQHTSVFKWLHESIGTNWRMTEMQAAIGRIALRRLPDWVATRRRNAVILNSELARLPGIRLTTPSSDYYHSYYKQYVFLNRDALAPGWNRDRIVRAIQAEGIPCGCGACGEVYLEKAFERLNVRPSGRLPAGRELGETGLMFMVHPTLSPDDMYDTAQAISKVLAAAAEPIHRTHPAAA